MSDIIHLLPDSVANQIAAGEVIQRPSSVVKELIENAIDAGATSVQVLITDAGKTCIQVIDNGKGMSQRDARLSFERHATSKINKADDLFKLTTMGFRGEALASIAAVAQVELVSRTKDEELGSKIIVAGSKVELEETVTAPVGSNFMVKNLFFNIPARRKFLKTNATELSHILNEFQRLALVNPTVSFRLFSDDTELFNLPAVPLRQRVISIFGKKMNQNLLEIEVDTSLIKVEGYITKADSSRKRGAHQFFFVNGRYMRHPYFHKAVMDAYEELIAEGNQISYFVYLTVDPANIDVNIHPTKTEIKFENEQGIWQIIAAGVKESLGRFNEVPSIDFDTTDMPEIPSFETSEPVFTPTVEVDSTFNPFKPASTSSYQRKPVEWDKLYGGLEKASKINSNLDTESIFIESKSSLANEDALEFGLNEEVPYEKGRQLLQFKGHYILSSVKSGLMFIDQHRAHVRVLYDKYLQQIKQKSGVSQRVLFPELIQLPQSEALVLETLQADFLAVGFDLSSLGGGSYSINGIPSGIEGINPVELVRKMLHTAMEKGSDVKEEVQSILALTLARSSAIVQGQVLSLDEMVMLVDSLFACELPNYTPDGLPVLATILDSEIERKF